MLRTGQTFAGLRVVGSLTVSESGEVYLVKAPQAPREDVLLLLPESRGADPAYRQTFDAAATAAAGLDHPAIVPVRSHGVEGGRLWLRSGYAPAPALDAVLRQSGPFAPREAAAAVTALAGALDAARSGGVPVGDLAPAQVLVEQTPHGTRYLLTGLGVPPAAGRPPRPEDRADQAALGEAAVLLLTGAAATGARVTALRPELPGAVDEVLDRVRRPAAQRYESCADFAAAFSTALLGADEAGVVAREASATVAAAAAAKADQPTNAYPTTGPNTAVPPAGSTEATWTNAPAPGFGPPPGGPRGSGPQPVPGAMPPGGYGPPPTRPYTGPASAPFPPQQPYAAGPGGYPQQGPPSAGLPVAGRPAPGGGSGRDKKMLIALFGGLGVLLVVLALVLAFVLGRGGDDTTTATSSSSSTTTTTTASSTRATATVVGGVPTGCALGAPIGRSRSDGLDAGPVRIPATAVPQGWSPDRGSVMPFLVTTDGIRVSRPAGESWQAQIFVGTLPVTFTGDLAAVARKYAECVAEIPGYENSGARPTVIDHQESGTLDNSPTGLVLIRGHVPVSRGAITADEFTLVLADTSPRSLSFGVAANTDQQSKDEIATAIKETLFRSGR
ncbi:MAG: hypothetical protein QM809_13785 [Gordonia sp. (in: high G+C Gram-positive bacteria)]|uniref:hypothetical protein n=1 Tax=Gordonia sp. (in: high G+C Gram-positive bacteria) TaxID=84139 RepID=UPI0039E6072E